MKRTLTTFFLALFFVTGAQAIQVGDRQTEVMSTMGKPVAARKKPDGAQVWRFKDGSTVWLANGIVQKFAGPTAGNSISRDGSIVPVTASHKTIAPVAKKAPATNAPLATPSNGESSEIAQLRTVGYGLLILAIAIITVSKAQFLIGVCRVGGVWLVSWFFAPLVSFILATLTGGKARSVWRL